MSFLRSFGPAVARVSVRDAMHAGIGALIGLGLTGLFLLSPQVDPALGLYLVAPFGASSVLLFAVPNSPLAQPWSALVGNTVAALVGVAVCLIVADPVLRVALAVGLAITVTMLCRALHPPAGAVAMTAALSPDAVAQLGFRFALAPIFVGTLALVTVATVYARMTGRRYPFRQFEDQTAQGPEDRAPSERLGLPKDELIAILDRYSQTFNVGVEDLARLIGAAERRAAGQAATPLTAGDIMSRDLVTVEATAGLDEVAALFRQHRITALPVVASNDRFLGLVVQMHIVDCLQEGRLRRTALFGIFRRRGPERVSARDLMRTDGPRATEATPLGALLAMMAEGEAEALPVLAEERLVGIVTRTDLVAALARRVAQTEA